MRTRRVLSALCLVLAVGLAACGDDSDTPLVTRDGGVIDGTAPRGGSHGASPGDSAVPPPPGPQLDPDVPTRIWKVRPGDSLRRIARRVYGDEEQWESIRDANPEVIGPGGTIHPGDDLVIPYDGL